MINRGDFKIAWQPLTTHISISDTQIEEQILIPSGEINFSDFERKNPEIQELMKYVRAILSFAIFCMFGKNLWATLMTTLGIAPSIYESVNDESRTAQTVTKYVNEQREIKRYNEWLRRNRK